MTQEGLDSLPSPDTHMHGSLPGHEAHKTSALTVTAPCTAMPALPDSPPCSLCGGEGYGDRQTGMAEGGGSGMGGVDAYARVVR